MHCAFGSQLLVEVQDPERPEPLTARARFTDLVELALLKHSGSWLGSEAETAYSSLLRELNRSAATGLLHSVPAVSFIPAGGSIFMWHHEVFLGHCEVETTPK